MSRSSALVSVAEDPDGEDGFRAARARVAMLKTSSGLWLQQFAQSGELFERDAHGSIVAEQEFLTRVGTPAHLGDTGRENAGQTRIQQAVGDGADAETRAHARQEWRQEF